MNNTPHWKQKLKKEEFHSHLHGEVLCHKIESFIEHEVLEPLFNEIEAKRPFVLKGLRECYRNKEALLDDILALKSEYCEKKD